jgi:predicted phosphodiesterase
MEKNKVELSEEGGYSVFTKIKSRDFKILQLTDIHIGGGFLSRKKDSLALAAVKKLVEYSKPDLIIITGDLVYPLPIFSGSLNNKKESKLICGLLDSFGIPWTLVFGNHDAEKSSALTKEQLADFYINSCKNCLLKKGEESIFGIGNYMIKLNNEDNTINTALMLLDSNAYLGKGFYSGFDVIHDDQIEWYKKEIKSVSKGQIAPSLAFFHIPVKEFKDGWDKCYRGSSEAVYHFGFVGEKDNYFGYAKTKQGNFFAEMERFGSCKGMFMGHDHLNTLSMTYRGIRLTYGMSIDFLAYKGIHKKKTQRGGTLITIDDKAIFNVKHLPLSDI